MSSFVLKLIAMICMVIDHTGMVFFPKVRVLRMIGRVSFPLYAFMIAEGYEQTDQRGRTRQYALRLACLAALSELPYDFGLYGAVPRTDHTNVIVTLLLGLTALIVLHKADSRLVRIPVIVFCGWAAETVHSSYGFAGVALILLYDIYLSHLADKNTGTRFLYLSLCALLFAGYYIVHNARSYDPGVILQVFRRSTWTQTGILFTIPLLTLYNRKKGYRSTVFQWFYRLFYPLHLAVFALCRIL